MENHTIMNLVLKNLVETMEGMDDIDPSQIPPLDGSIRLVGRESLLSSIELVSLIVGIEEKLADEHEILITIADERAMSLEKSPFRTVESLTDYIALLLSEKN